MVQPVPVYTFSLTRQELILFSFLENGLRSSAEQKVKLKFIVTDSNAQDVFNKWLVSTYEAPQKINHAELVASLWEKTRRKVDADLAAMGGTAFSQEVTFLRQAEDEMAKCSKQGKPGKSFTAKQVTVLLQAGSKAGVKK